MVSGEVGRCSGWGVGEGMVAGGWAGAVSGQGASAVKEGAKVLWVGRGAGAMSGQGGRCSERGGAGAVGQCVMVPNLLLGGIC